jgi:hypothetical protein
MSLTGSLKNKLIFMEAVKEVYTSHLVGITKIACRTHYEDYTGKKTQVTFSRDEGFKNLSFEDVLANDWLIWEKYEG